MLKTRSRIGTWALVAGVLSAAAHAVPADLPANEWTVQVEGLACPFCAHGLEKLLKKLKTGTVTLCGIGTVTELNGQWLFTLRGTPAKHRLSEAATASPLTQETQPALWRLAHSQALVAVSGEVRDRPSGLPELRLEHYEKVQ